MRHHSRGTRFLVAAVALSGCANMFLRLDHVEHSDPALTGAKWEEARFRSDDGTALTGLWFPAATLPAKGVVVQFHGNGENVTLHFLFVYWLARDGWDVLAFDYRGFGASGGTKSLKGSVQDGVAALDYARARAPGLPLVVIGQSLGGAIALASLDRDGGADLRALVLDSTFASYQRVAETKVPLLLLLRPLSPILMSRRFSPDRLIVRRKLVPLLVVHALGDPTVPYAQGRRLYADAPQPKEFWDVPGKGHVEAFGRQGEIFRPRLLKFLDAALADSGSKLQSQNDRPRER